MHVPIEHRLLPLPLGQLLFKHVLEVTLKELKNAEFCKGTILLMDRGFYSLAVIVILLESGFQFIMGMPLTAPFYKQAIREAYDVILDTESYYPSIRIHAWTKTSSGKPENLQNEGGI